ncbi:FIP1[V]-like protein [Rutidosis leptorrhynchoides]|uniref:FIP1[V]-like protein n=1 Tax=Rutidosis leptorrhynchoides TaxID=125765 RepID=UPI003A99854E
MEDDDEFGDLYTDVLHPLQMSSAPPVQSTPAPISRSIDLNDRIPSDDEEILFGSKSSETLKSDHLDLDLNKLDPAPLSESGARVLVKGESKGFEKDLNFEDGIKGESNNNNNKDDIMDENFGIEEAGEDDEFLIPGLSSSGARVFDGKEGEGGGGGGGGDDWDDSDSDDDLQIVLNDDSTGGGMMGMEGGVGLEEEVDEDGNNLVIGTGNADPNYQHHHQPMDEMQDWGEDGSQGGAELGGERKDLVGGDGAKVDGSGAVGQKIGYGGHGYHPFHSQFKYVRPGAAPMPGGGPIAAGGAPGQVRPPGSMLPFAGRGRGEWRPPGIKNFPPNMQKNGHPGYGMPTWGNNGAGRGFGSGLDFTLPSHKTIFEVDIDSFEDKPWRHPGVDVSDFFNFGMNEETWKEYCKQLEQHRMEATMQSKIRVYESGRTEQEYDPDLPPELAAAAAGHEIPLENRNVGTTDVQNDLAKGSAHERMQLPTGKAIQVETSFSERLPSIDTRPPRMRDSDAIIEIVLQRSPDQESLPGDDVDVVEHLEDVPLKENHNEDPEIEDEVGSGDDHFDKPRAYNGRKKEVSGRRVVAIHKMEDTGNRVQRFSETEVEDHHYDSTGRTSKKYNPLKHTERPMKRTAADRSPRFTDDETQQEKKVADNRNEESTESVDHKQSPSSSPLILCNAEDRSFEQNDANIEDDVNVDGNSNPDDDIIKDEKLKHTLKKQKLSTRAERSSVERVEDREDSKAGRSSENSKGRSGSSKDMENEVIQARSSIHRVNVRKPVNEDDRFVRPRNHDEKQERERYQMPVKGMEDPYYHRKWVDPNHGYRSHTKSENFDRKKGREPEGPWVDDMRKRSHDEEMASRHRNKAREIERSDKHEHRSRKLSEDGVWKGDPNRDMMPPLKRDDGLKVRHNDPDGMHKAMIRESTSRRKRERDDGLDLPKRDEDPHSFRYKEEVRLQREKVEKQKERERYSRLKEDYRSSEKEYMYKDTVREPISRREKYEKFENESVSRHKGREDAYAYAHGNKINNEERTSRHERGYTGSSKDTQVVHEKKHKETLKKGKESDGGVQNSLATSKRHRESDHISQRSERESSRGMLEQRSSDQNPAIRKSSKRHRENANASSEDEPESKKGRSKLERWTSHKDRDFNLPVKSSSASVDPKETDRYKDNGPPPKLPEESSKLQEIVENSKPLAEEKNDDPTKHLDTVEKLKKRSERFKLPMPSEKETLTIKKIENEPLTQVQPEPRHESEVKSERPARKRRWTSG